MPNPAHKCSTCGKYILVKTRGMAFLDFLERVGEEKEVGEIMREGRERKHKHMSVHTSKKRKNPTKTNPPHPEQPITHTPLFSKPKRFAACSTNSQVPRAGSLVSLHGS